MFAKSKLDNKRGTVNSFLINDNKNRNRMSNTNARNSQTEKDTSTWNEVLLQSKVKIVEKLETTHNIYNNNVNYIASWHLFDFFFAFFTGIKQSTKH